ncbi:hypothetical protein [Dyella terrae]|uniref:hypothetical protein n=1 Tax=Dyella terrae TaxID=522259 RepID=UPI001EFCAB16|nr:hypothetical protein [Dyella terrae]ULU23764.1 hypothetical protein DYST_00662 [Dyella terrae]
MTKTQSNLRADGSALLSLLLSVYVTDPRDRLICPVTEGRYSTVLGLIPTSLAVLRVAAEIEADPAELVEWYLYVTISELGHLTAKQLVSMGRAEDIILFLRSVRDGERG